MTIKRVPVFNEKFKLSVFFLIVRKSAFFILFVFAAAIISGFLYLRYTPMEYASSAILQINPSNNTNLLLKIDKTLNQEDDLSYTVERLRSKEFLKTVFKKLPLQIRYFREGTFLSEELYKRSPFIVEIDTIYDLYKNKPIYIEIENKDTAILIYNIGDQEFRHKVKTDAWQKTKGGTLKIIIKDYQVIESAQNNIKQNKYFFQYSDEKSLLKENIKKLNIVIENQLARTIKVTFRDKDPIKVSDVVNTIAEEFLKYDVDRKKRSTAGILKFIDKQSALVYEKLNYLDRQIKKIQQDNNFFTETTNEILPNIYLNKLNLLEDRILDLGYERSALQRISDILENQKSINVYEIIGLLTGIESENLLMSILNNLQELFSKRQSLLNDITDNNLKIKLIDKQIAQQKQEILKLVNSILIRINQELADVKNKITGYKNKLNIKGFDEMEFSRLQRLYTVNEKYYNQLLEKKAEYMIYEAGYVSNDVILEKASPAKYPISPIKTQIFVALFIVSFVVIFIYLIFRYLFFDQIVSIEDILDFTEVPLLGVIPLIKMNESVSNLVIEDGNNSIVSEAFRSMRTNLFFFKQIKGKQIISITSTVAGEGKTFIAINLSAIIAKSGKKVILLDLDMRKPRLHLSFNSKNEIGMSNLLIGDNSLEECIHSGPISNLDFITTGPIPPNPSELVVRPEMDIILSELKKHYDVIIMDTPPVGLVADAFVNFKKADYPIYVLRANYSKKTFINNINLIREEKKIDSISLVLNAYEVNDAEYGYGYGYGYGYLSEKTSYKKKYLFRKK